jgi:hypothetical protein
MDRHLPTTVRRVGRAHVGTTLRTSAPPFRYMATAVRIPRGSHVDKPMDGWAESLEKECDRSGPGSRGFLQSSKPTDDGTIQGRFPDWAGARRHVPACRMRAGRSACCLGLFDDASRCLTPTPSDRSCYQSSQRAPQPPCKPLGRAVACTILTCSQVYACMSAGLQMPFH